jgi:COP9 signalosome complex subunit 2
MSDDEEEYEFDYSDEDEDMDMDGEGDLHVQIENQYYAAKQYLESEPPQREAALAALSQVLTMQVDKTDWGFKALKRIVKLHFELGQHDEAMRQYEELLGYTKSDVTRNVGEKGINSILDFVSTSKVKATRSALVAVYVLARTWYAELLGDQLYCVVCAGRTGRFCSDSTRRRWKR